MTLERTGMRGTAGAVAIRWREGAVEFHYFYHTIKPPQNIQCLSSGTLSNFWNCSEEHSWLEWVM